MLTDLDLTYLLSRPKHHRSDHVGISSDSPTYVCATKGPALDLRSQLGHPRYRGYLKRGPFSHLFANPCARHAGHTHKTSILKMLQDAKRLLACDCSCFCSCEILQIQHSATDGGNPRIKVSVRSSPLDRLGASRNLLKNVERHTD